VDLFLDRSQRRTIGVQLYGQLREAIERGRLLPGDRLPPSRQLADELGIARHTVTTVYGRLAAEGFIDGHAGAGSVVTTTVTADHTLDGASDLTSDGAASMSATTTAATAPTAAPKMRRASVDPPVRFDLRVGAPDPELFPLVDWRRAVTWSLQRPPSMPPDPEGDIDLRRSITRWIGRSRSVVAGVDQLHLTAGAQQAFDLVARALLRSGDVVAVEDPGYHLARRCFEVAGARIVGIPVDDHGLVVDAIPSDARLVYTTPSHQMPLGVTMSMPRRVELLALGRRSDLVIVEDDYDSEFRHVDRPLEPLHRLDRGERVVYVGSFSKTLGPALRLGFAVVPRALVDPLRELRAAVGWQPPATDQSALHRLITDGSFDRHLRRTRRVYAERHRELRAQLAAHPDSFTGIPTNAGLHITAWLPHGCDEAAAVAAARDRGVAVECLGAYRIAPGARGALAIGFGTIASNAIADAISTLADAVGAAR